MDSAVGGLVGNNETGSISQCYSQGKVADSIGDGSGGLVGINYGHILDCWSLAEVNGHAGVGGLIGMNWGSVERSFSSGPVNSPAGGLIGMGDSCDTLVSFWDINTSGQTTSAGGTGKTTAQMMTRNTFTDVGWDFNDVWHICEGDNYPKLFWQMLPGDIVCPDGIDFEDIAELCDEWLLEQITADWVPPGGDGIVNFADFATLADQWYLASDIDILATFSDEWLGVALNADISPLPDGDGRVDTADFAVMANDWLNGF